MSWIELPLQHHIFLPHSHQNERLLKMVANELILLLPQADFEEFKKGTNFIYKMFVKEGIILDQFIQSLKLMVHQVVHGTDHKERSELCRTIGHRMKKLDNKDQDHLLRYIESSDIAPELKKVIAESN